ncbi:MAG: hypothetical protein U9O98_06980 [Asgard group archaeon]|nr:hypothetical protein [Asgard group archaeon]
MSENIDCNLSVGVTATGKIGRDIIVGVISIDKEEEVKLLANNLIHSSHMINIVGKDYEKNVEKLLTKEKTKQYITSLLRNDAAEIKIFRLQPKEQFQLLQAISILEGKKLYEIGKSIDGSNYQYHAKALQMRYHYPKTYLDVFMKSLVQYFALNYLIKQKECGHVKLFKNNIKKEQKMALHIIVNGGAHFSCYQDLLNDNLKHYWDSIKTDQASTFYWNLMVATHGISQASIWYPIVSSIDFLVQSLSENLDSFLYTNNTLIDVTADQIEEQKDLLGKSMIDVLHDLYLERTGSTFRSPKLWRIGDFSNLGEYELALPYLMLQKSIKEKRITAREVDDEVKAIDKFYEYNNPLDRDAYVIGRINEEHHEIISKLEELGIDGMTILDNELVNEYRNLLDNICDHVENGECIISKKDQELLLKRLDKIQKRDFKTIESIEIQDI